MRRNGGLLRYAILHPMMTQNVKKHRQIYPNVDTSVTIADVPVKISIYHGEKLLKAYDDTIDLEFAGN